MNGLDLFSGIGGLTIAMEGIARPVAYCENDRFAQAVLLSRQRDGRLPIAPIWNDVRSLKANVLPARIDIMWGGFPCQDISVAGNGKGLAGGRSWLFSEIMRLAQEIKPKFIFLENVPAIRTRGLEHVVEWLASAGYDCRWDFVSAAEVGAVHIRQRWFLLAHANSIGLRKKRGKIRKERICKTGPLVADGASPPRDLAWTSARPIKPFVDRTGDGLLGNVDRCRALGNAVVPRQAREAFERLIGW